MKKIAGDIEVMPVADLVAWLSSKSLTGRATFTRGNIERSFILQGGTAIQGASADPREYLGQHLINFDYIDEVQLEKAFQTQRETAVFLGRILIMVGQITEDQLERVLSYKVRESLLDTLSWGFGTFEFASDVSWNAELNLSIPVSLAEVHSEGLSRAKLWTEMRRIFPSNDLRCEVLSRPQTSSASDLRLFEQLEQGLTISDLLLRQRALEFHVFARLYDLYQRGHIRPKEAITKPSPEKRQQLQEALDKRDFHQAYKTAQKVLDHDANDAEALEAVSIVQDQLLRESAASVELLDKVPALLVSRKQTTSGEFTAKERYVLSRIDGSRTVGQIIQVSPVAEAEIISIVKHFCETQLIELREPSD